MMVPINIRNFGNIPNLQIVAFIIYYVAINTNVYCVKLFVQVVCYEFVNLLTIFYVV